MAGTQNGKVPSDVRMVRTLMRRAGLDEQSAARALEIEEATMQGYASGAAVPRRIVFALMQLADLGLSKLNSPT